MESSTPSLSTPDAVATPTREGDSGEGQRNVLRRHPWVFVCVGIVALSTALVLWARTSPGFDPYGWLVWGYQTVRLNLGLKGAPSWKPVTWVFTTPYSLAGSFSYWLWMVTAVATGIGGSVVAGRIAYRLVRSDAREGERQWPAILGACFAGAALLGINTVLGLAPTGAAASEGYFHYILSAQSDPMLTTFFLLAIDMHMCGRHRWAFTFLWLGSLGRPETWPFLGLYFLWCWREVPKMRLFMIIGLILVPFLWFGVPVLSGSSPFVAGQLADNSPRELHSNKIIGVLSRFRHLSYWPVQLAAGIGLVIAARERNRSVLIIGGMSALWVLVEIVFALHGWPAVPRYMFQAAGAMIVVAGFAVGWILQRAARATTGLRFAGLAFVVVLSGLLVPDAIALMRQEHGDLKHERERTTEIRRLPAAIDALGGVGFIRSCGDPSADVEYVSILAWYMNMNVGKVGHRPHFEIFVQDKPAVLFTALYNGWIVHTYHIAPAKRAICARLNDAVYIVTPQHPGGVILHTS